MLRFFFNKYRKHFVEILLYEEAGLILPVINYRRFHSDHDWTNIMHILRTL